MQNGPHADPDDVELESLIYRQIRDLGGLHVKVKNDVVTLSGTTDNFDDKRKIDAEVRNLVGTRRLIDEVRVIEAADEFHSHRGGQ